MSLPRLAVAVATALAAVAPATASAVEPTGRGANVTPVLNVPYPNTHQTGTANAGTDVEFATIKKRTFAFAGSYGDGLQIVDITDPRRATRVATWDCGVAQGDVQVFRRSDLKNHLFVAYTHDTGYTFQKSACADELKALGFTIPSGGYGTYIADVTDPYHPRAVSFVSFPQGSHNQTVHPSGRYLYNSNSDLITSPLPAVEIADITDLAHPKQVGELPLMTFPGLGTESHDIGFNSDGTRAYVAALSHGEIIDTTDPAHPVSIGKVIDPAINVWHETETIRITDPVLGTRDFLLAEDEVAGATGTGQCPNGGVHVYDITGDLEQAPVKVGYWNIDDVGLTEDGVGTCTAHVFQLHREAKLMTIAYYNGGVRVVDLSGLVGVALGGNGMGMRQLGWYRFPDSDTWSVKAPTVSRDGFYMYGNDHRRGFDVYRYAPSPGGPTGEWMTPEQAQARADRGKQAGLVLYAVCLLDTSDQQALRDAAARAGYSLAST
jgi:hypothetical protein